MLDFSLMPIEALNLEKIKKHGADGFVVLSANRDEIESEDNRVNIMAQFADWLQKNDLKDEPVVRKDFLRQWNVKGNEELVRDIREKGYMFSVVYDYNLCLEEAFGSYRSLFVVYNRKKAGEVSDWNELYGFALAMCGKYSQDRVCVQAPGKAAIWCDAEGKAKDLFSQEQMKADAATHFAETNSIFEGKFYRPALRHEYVDRLLRTQCGEVFLG